MNKFFILCLSFFIWNQYAAAQTVFNESFDGSSTPTGWVQSAATAGPWIFSTNADYDVRPIYLPEHTGNNGNYAWVDYSSNIDSVVLETPTIDVSTLTTPYLQFYHESHFMMTTTAQTLNTFNILNVDAWNGSTWVNVDALQGNTPLGWDARGYDMSTFTYAGGDSLKVRFMALRNTETTRYLNDLLIDDVSVMEAPTCVNPNLLDTTSVGVFDALLSWNEVGTATQWQVEYGPAGFTPGTGTTVIANTSPSATITGLNSQTDYSYYVRSICGAGDTSMLGGAGPYNFSTKISCPAPSALTTNNLTATTVDLAWTENGAATMWEIEYGLDGFTQGTGTSTVVTSNPSNITGLIDNTDYDFYVRAICGAADSSVWVGPSSFATPCGAFTPTYTEDFTTFLDACWSEAQGRLGNSTTLSGTTSSWAADGFGNVGTTGAARMNIFGTTRDEWLISPSIDLGTGATTYQLEFDVALTDFSGTGTDAMGPDDTLAVVISTDNGATWSTTNILQTWTAANQPSTTGDAILLNLSGYTGVVKFGFYAASSVSNTDYNVYIDNFLVRIPPSCIEPSNLASSNVTDNSADLNWTENGTATQWVVEYGPQGFTSGTGTTVFVNSNPATISGLLDNTTYEYEVRAICAPGDTSTASFTRNSFTTLLAPFSCTTGNPSIVYSEDFEGSFPTGWNQVATGDPDWTWDGSGGTTSSGTGPNAAQSGSGFMYLETSSGSAGDADTLTSPSIDLSTVSAARLEFQYHMYGNDIGTLSVEVSDDGGTTWTPIWSRVGQQQTSNAAAWLIASPDLTPYIGSMIMLRFIGTKGSGGLGYEGDMAIDLVQIKACVSCSAPSGLTTNNITANTVDFAWTENGSATQWEVEYGTPGFTPGTGTNILANTNPLNITGLTANTSYDLYVRAICGAGDTSLLAGPISITTPCAAFVPTYTEDFTSYLDPCWSEAKGRLVTSTVLTGTTSFWQADGFGNVGTTGAARMNIYSTNRNEWLISPSIDLGTGTTPYQLDFDVILTDFSGTGTDLMGPDDTLAVVISTDNGATWSTVNILQSWVAGAQPSNTGERAIIDLTAYTGIVKFGFYAASSVSNTDYNVYIDNFVVRPRPSCPEPTLLTTSNITATTADLDWTENGSATQWEVEYGAPGFTLGTGTMTLVTSKPTQLTGLTAETDYEFYVRAVCGPGDSSLWSSSTSFSTPCAALVAPYLEEFPTNSLPSCWTEGGQTTWEYGSLGGTTPTGFADYGARNIADHSVSGTGTFIGMDGSDNTNGEVSTLLSPFVDVTPLTTPELSYWVFSNNVDDAAQNKLIVEFYDGANWIVVDSIQSNLGANWVEFKTDLSTFTITGDVQVRFTVTGDNSNGGSTFYNDILIDDVALREKVIAPFEDVAPSGYLGLDSVYCGATVGIGGSLIITNNTSVPANNVVFGITINGNPVYLDSIPALAANTSDTIVFSPFALTPGTYEVSAITNYMNDSLRANDTLSTTINVSNPTVNIVNVVNVSCNGFADGSATAVASGGVPSYTYAWSFNPSTTATATGLPAGNYSVTVTDSVGCSASTSTFVTEPTLLVATASEDGTGNAIASGTGGTVPYTYAWDDPAMQTTDTAMNLTNGLYNVTITDFNGCTDSASVTVVITGLESIANLSGLSLFPNPTSNNAFIQLDLVQTADVTVQVTTVTGQSVMTKMVGAMQSEQIELPTASLPTGVYLVQINIGQEQVTRKLIISRN